MHLRADSTATFLNRLKMNPISFPLQMRLALQRTGWVFVLLTVILAACSGPRETVDREEADELPTPAVEMSDYEDFDPAPYREADVGPVEDVEHDVPDALMDGRADEGVTASVRGYRVQVYLSLNRDEAITQEEAAKSWLSANSEAAPPGVDSLPVYRVYVQPYYRVRLGNFRSREAAERARAFLAQRFPDASIVPDTVEITR